jgi:hypothetical protein
MHRFQVSTVSGGTTAPNGVNLASLTIVNDVAASNRGTPTRATTDGIITYLQSGTPSGSFEVTYGICRTGTATYSASNPNCATGVIHYDPGVTSLIGDDVGPVFGVTTNTYQPLDSAITAPATVPAGGTATVKIAPAPSSVPRAQTSSGVTAVVNNSQYFAAYYPIPAGFTYVSHKLTGGDLLSVPNSTATLCTTFGAAANLPCSAKAATGQYVGNTQPYMAVRLATGNLPGGQQMTMPTLELTLQATGTPGTTGNVTMMEFLNLTSATFIITTNATFDGYPTTGNNTAISPPVAPANVLKAITIT